MDPFTPIATWIVPCNSRSVQVDGTTSRSQTIRLTLSSYILNCMREPVPVAVETQLSSG